MWIALFLVGVGNASAQQPSDGEWQQLARLQQQFTAYQQSGKVDKQAEVAELILDFMQRRFPQRLHYIALALLADARAGQSRLDEAIALHEQVLSRLEKFRPVSSSERAQAARIQGFSLRGLAACHGRLGNWDESVKRFQETIRWWDASQEPGAGLMAADARKDLAFVLRNMGEIEQASQYFHEAVGRLETLAAEARDPRTVNLLLTHALGGWASIDIMRGRYDLADPKLRRAIPLAIAARGKNHPITAQLFVDLGNVYDSQRRWEEAAPYYQAALEAYEESLGPQHPETMKAIVGLARMLRFQDKSIEATRLLRRAVESRKSLLGEGHISTADAMLNLAGTLLLTDNFDEAETILRKTVDIYQGSYGPNSADEAESLMMLAALAAEQGNNKAAHDYLAQVLDIHQINPLNPRYLVHVHYLKATMLWDIGKRQEAVNELENALDVTETQRGYSTGTEFERAEMFARFSDELDTMIRWQAELKHPDEMFTAIERGKARSFLDELRLANVDLLVGLPASKRTELAQREYELRKALTEALAELDRLKKPEPDAPVEERERWNAAIDALVSARQQLYFFLVEARLESPVYRELISADAELTSLSTVQQALDNGELWLVYSIGRDASYVMAIRHDSAEISELTVPDSSAVTLGVDPGPLTEAKLAELMVQETDSVYPVLSDCGDIDKLNQRLAALWAVLIPAEEQRSLTSGDVGHLTVMPDSHLCLLPFETLVVTIGQNLQYLLDVGPAISYVPSASVWNNLKDRNQSSSLQREPVLTLGDPAYPQDQDDPLDRLMGVETEASGYRSSHIRLPFSGRESEWVEDHFTAAGLEVVRLNGTNATESELRRLAAGRQILHLACHGLADFSYGNLFGMLSLMPGSVTDAEDDGNLLMSEIYDLDLTGCELAILSACQTNYGPHQSGEGVWALSRGFLVAGARRVVASNWVVNDAAGATLVSYFAYYLAAEDKADVSRDYAQSLHDSKKQVRKQAEWSHPYFWGSLVLVGPE